MSRFPTARMGIITSRVSKPGSNIPYTPGRKGNLEAQEELIVNVNEMADGHDYYALTGLNISTGQPDCGLWSGHA